MVASRDYDGYGNPTVTGGTARTPFGYSGEYTDSESGLVYPLPRYYDPPTQQFLSRDTLLTQLPYAYVNGNPLNFTDPSGHCLDGCIGELALVAGAVACPECVVVGLLVTAGAALTVASAAIIYDYLVRQNAANQVCSLGWNDLPHGPKIGPRHPDLRYYDPLHPRSGSKENKVRGQTA